MIRGKLLALGIGASFLLPSAHAATRTVQFSGIAGTQPTHDNTINAGISSDCRIVIANTGNTDQIVTGVTIISFNPSTGQSSLSGPIDSMKIDSTTSTTATDCTSGANNIVKPGGFCIFRTMVQNVLYDGYWTVCAGFLQVTDRTAATPGSVVAAGAIMTAQEAKVLGGVMSGAFYGSGTHLWSTSNVQGPPSGASYGIPTGKAHNMNFFCMTACDIGTGGTKTTWCEENCGHWPGGDPGGWTHNIPSYLEPMDSSLLNGSDTNTLTTYNGGSTTPDNATPPSMMNRTANAHYAGGMVYEMIVGPLTSVCSGNKSYWSAGGQDFTHADGVDGHSWIMGTSSIYPPERLICNHRHAGDDLYMGVGMTSTFTINGGNAF